MTTSDQQNTKQVVHEWADVPYPPPTQLSATLVYKGGGNGRQEEECVLGLAREWIG